MTRGLACAFLLLLLTGAPGQTQGQGGPALAEVPRLNRKTRWRQDLELFRSRFGAGQRDFAKLYDRGDFNATVDMLEADADSLSDDEITLSLMKLVARANVAHNSVLSRQSGFSSRLPLGFTWFSDGMAVTAAVDEYQFAIGARVLKIGNLTPEEVLSALAPYISHENDFWLQHRAPELVRTEAALRHFGLLDSDGRVSVRLRKPGAPEFTLAVAPEQMPAQLRMRSFLETTHTTTPLYLSRPGKNYWYQYLEGSNTLFIQYNRCYEEPDSPFGEFATQVADEADAHQVKRFVIDLRQNGGGDSRLIRALKTRLASRVKTSGRVYVLIGTGTFSSALMNAIELRRDLRATLVGQATGGKPNAYGQLNEFVLPNSNLIVTYTSRYFGRPHSTDSTLRPDIGVAMTLTDALAGRDPVLEAALAAQ